MSILTLGLGTFGSVNLLPTLGLTPDVVVASAPPMRTLMGVGT